LACGKPIVSTPIPEVVSIRQDAVAFYNNVSSLVNTLVDILSDKNIRTSLKKGLSTSQEIMIGD
jgi:glycosyltransferase involved in cell wall biosynthesis